jgi:adenylosuccinate lyase
LASERVLLALTESGWTREEAYAHVQRAARAVQADGTMFLDELLKDKDVTALLGRERLPGLLHVEPRYDMADRVLRRLGILED